VRGKGFLSRPARATGHTPFSLKQRLALASGRPLPLGRGPVLASRRSSSKKWHQTSVLAIRWGISFWKNRPQRPQHGFGIARRFAATKYPVKSIGVTHRRSLGGQHPIPICCYLNPVSLRNLGPLTAWPSAMSLSRVRAPNAPWFWL